MGKRSSQQRDTKPADSSEGTAAPKTVTLILLQNDYVDGKFCPGGTRRDFPIQQAEHRLKTTNKWIKA